MRDIKIESVSILENGEEACGGEEMLRRAKQKKAMSGSFVQDIVVKTECLPKEFKYVFPQDNGGLVGLVGTFVRIMEWSDLLKEFYSCLYSVNNKSFGPEYRFVTAKIKR
jgi:hypothetical protein